MQTVKRITILAVLAVAALSAQVNVNIISPPPPGVSAAGFSQTGVTGAVTYYYQVVTNYPAGSALSPVFTLNGSNATLSGGNYNTMTWNGVANALSYDVLRFTTNAGYSGTCTCLVGTVAATATTTINDQSNTVTSYTATAAAAGATAQVYINTRDHVAPELRYVQNGVDQPLNATVGGTTVAAYTSGTGGTTQFTIVKISAGTVIKVTTGDTAPGVALGIAKETTLAGSSVNVTTVGTSSCLFDAGGVTSGNLVGVSTTTAGNCKDLGTASLIAVAANVSVLGRALATGAGAGNVRIALGIGAENSGGAAQNAITSLTGDVTATGPGAAAASVVKINGGAVPISATVLGSNGSGQPVASAGGTTFVAGSLDDCATTAACPNTLQTVSHTVIGRGTLSSGTPSTYAVTGIAPAFTSSTTFVCQAQDTTTIANNIGVLTAGYVSGSAVTFTGPNTNTDTFRFECTGY